MSEKIPIGAQKSGAEWLAANLTVAELRRMGARESEAEHIMRVVSAIAATLAWLHRNGDRIRGAFGKTALETDGVS